MFEQSILKEGKTRRPWTIGLAVILELAVVGVLILIPLLYVQAIPIPELNSMLIAPPPPPPPPPPPAPAQPVKVHKTAPRKFNPEQLTAPRVVPKQTVEAELQPPPALPEAPAIAAVPGGIPGGVAGGVANGVVSSVPPLAPPPPPPKAEPVTTPKRVHIGGQVQAAKIEKEIEPKYPVIAKSARVQGTVRLKAIIGRDGRVENLSLISGHPLLAPAAINAVKQWVYKPTYLNGNPVEVDTEIDVTFTLAS